MIKAYVTIISCLFLLLGCTSQNPEKPSDNNPIPSPIETDVGDDEENTISASLLDYFPDKPIVKGYLGTGNEYAQYTETFYQKEGEYIPSIIDNGGTRVLRIYKVTEDEISIVYEQSEFYNETIPSISALEPAFQSKPILTSPLELGGMNGEWKIVDINHTLKVPYKEFNHVLVIEKTNTDGSVNRQYWVKQLGKIKDEFIIEEENGDRYEVTSELQTAK